MKIHTCASIGEVYGAAHKAGVFAYVTQKGSRKRERAFDVTLYVESKDDLHRRFGNSGGYGRSNDVSATWDEWGLFMVALYDIDPEAIMGWAYATRPEFYERTREERDRTRKFYKPESLAYRTHTAPWLD